MMGTAVEDRPLHLVGIGHALADRMFAVEDSFLSSHGLRKGEMHLCDRERMAALRASLPPSQEHAAGGSCANSVVLASRLGLRCAFLGRVAEDEEGRLFRESLRRSGVEDCLAAPCLSGEEQGGEEQGGEEGETGCCYVLITPDAERSFATHLGIASALRVEDLDTSAIESARVLYLEGYLFGDASGVFEKAAAVARAADTRVALCLSDTTCVLQHREGLAQFLSDHVDVLFTNEAEAQALFRLEDLQEEALHERLFEEFSTFGALVCLTLGAEGALVVQGGKAVPILPYRPCRVRDTTGAGDAFAAGMLYGLTSGWSLEDSGALASELGGRVVETIGPRLTSSVDSVLRSVMRRLLARGAEGSWHGGWHV